MLKNKKLLIITSVIILLPILAGLLLWDKLPEQMPMHWNAEGDVDGWMAKPIAVYAPPFFMLVLHLLCVLVTATDPKNKTQGIKVLQLTLWICPVISVFLNAMVYAASMGIAVDASLFGPLLVGMVLVIVGNYLPKCRQNYTIGIKLPWTLNSEENWNATHRFAGRIWVAGGMIVLLTALLPGVYAFAAAMGVLVVVVVATLLYSILYHKKHEH